MSEEGIFSLVVHGKPEPRGSKASRVLYKDRKEKVPHRRPDGTIMSVVYDTNEHASLKWMRHVEITARAKWQGPPLSDVGLDAVLTFFVERPPTSHYGTGRNVRIVKESAPARPIVRPDLDKLGRSTLDALTGVVWHDDSQIVGLSMDKRYAVPLSEQDDGQGVVIKVALASQQRAGDLPIDLRTRWISPNDDESSYPQDSLLADAAG